MTLPDRTLICFFDDEAALRFRPLTLTRPTDDLRCGILTLREKWLLELGTRRFRRKTWPELRVVFDAGRPVGDAESACWINSRLLPDPVTVRQLKELPVGGSLIHEDVLLAWKSDIAQAGLEAPVPVPESRVEADGELQLAAWLPDLLRFNGPEIERDMERLGARGSEAASLPGVHLLGNHPVHLESDARVEPGVCLITVDGPVYIGKGAHIQAGATLRGPVAVGDGATVRMGARIYENSSIGPVCKVAGEVQGSIFHSFSNKAHDGFVGSSLIGQWCNLGAGTTTSNLKNNYATVRHREWGEAEERETGEQFFGTVMGDHSRTGIQAMFSAGTLIGPCCNLFGSGFAPRQIPAFSWVDSGHISPYRFDKAEETIRRVMARRGRELSAEELTLLKWLHDRRDGQIAG